MVSLLCTIQLATYTASYIVQSGGGEQRSLRDKKETPLMTLAADIDPLVAMRIAENFICSNATQYMY